MRFTTGEIAAATDGTTHGPATTVDGASIDSRTVRAGQLFVPLVADRDGHDFLPAALEAGVDTYLTEREPLGGTAIQVTSTWEALSDLGRAARARIPDVVGVTGSVGKTTTKDLIGAALATTLRVHASRGSFNNRLGLPLTLLDAPDDVEVAVVELGASAVGEIAALCEVARPRIGVVTRVAPAHLEGFGSVDAVQRAKCELPQALPADGVAVLNADDPRVVAMRASTRAAVLTYGTAAEVSVEVLDVDAELRALISLTTPWGRAEVRLAARGAHQAGNAAAAVAVAGTLGVPLAAAAAALETAVLSPGRMVVRTLPSGAVLVDDSYNTSPLAAETSLRAVGGIAGARHVAVLGVMAELGDATEEEHRKVARVAADSGFELLTYRAPAYGAKDFEDLDDLAAAVGPLAAGDVVLVKGSRVAHLERLVERLGGPAA